MESQTPPAQPPLAKDWREKLANVWYRLKAADTALQIEKDGRRQRATEFAIVQAWKAGGHEGKHPLEDDEVAVSVGDTINYNHAPPESGGGLLSRAALATALVAAGAGGAAWWLHQNEPSDQREPTPAVDRDTQYQFRVVPELSGPRDA